MFFLTQRIGRQDAEEVAQEACGIVFNKYRMQEFTVNFDAWSHGVLKKTLSNWFKTQGRRNKHISEEDVETLADTHPDLSDTVFIRIVLDCLKKVAKANRRYARILTLKTYGYSIAEISERLNVTKNNACVILNRARALLEQCVETGAVQ